MIDDEVLIRGLKRGVKSAQERFYKEYYNNVYGQCLRTLRCKEDAEEVASYSIFKTIHTIKKFKGDCKLNSWLYMIAKNECLMLIRRTKKHNQQISADEFPKLKVDIENHKTVEHNDPFLRELVIKAFYKIDPAHRPTIINRFICGESNNKTAKILNSTPSAIKCRTHRGRNQFKKYILERAA